MSFRIGFGYDVHRLEEDLPFWLGGIEIAHHKGSVGHSDADVLLHAICDAILGAAALGDIGRHFPDTDPAYKGIASSILLKKCGELLSSRGYEIGNIDSTVCLQTPKISPYIPGMQKQIAKQLGLREDQVSVKATTEEKLGFTGREEGVSAYAVVLISPIALIVE
ncbi:MAG: 2-C-methyl-D-erythritol 2,4-cyclodiphosphate synthase [Bacteroidales bacterium]|nr:2-C-methyl-D-erythritol 2,4-cyclodiphosphate synthase [Bacteroidales bacterium]